MNATADSIELTIWTGASQLATLASLSALPSVRIRAIGGDANEVRRIAEGAGVPYLDDPRLLAGVDCDALLIMDPGRPFDQDVLDAMVAASEPSRRSIFSLTPRPGLDDAGADRRSPAARPIPVPCYSDTIAGRRFGDAASAFGRPFSASIEISGAEGEAFVHTRLFDAIDTLSSWFGLPARVQATAVHDEESPNRPMRHLIAQFGYSDGRAASLSLAASPGALQRVVTLYGPAGRLSCRDGAITWRDGDGRDVEASNDGASAPPDLAAQLAQAISWHLERAARPRDQATWKTLMAACEAVLLSARTGNAETIDSVRRMLGRV